MKEFYVCRAGDSLVEIEQNANSFRLLVEHDGVDIVVNRIKAQSVVWISPGEDHHYLEYYMILSGEVMIRRGEKEEHFKAGDSFYFIDFDEDISITPLTDIQLLCVSSKPVFGEFMNFITDLNDLNAQIEEKDHYTFGHCKRVMRYAEMIAHAMHMDDESVHTLILAALYHDLGKCYLPLEILNKPGWLNDEEFEVMRRHPTDSAKLLTGRFSKEVAMLARAHHERLDGSGYPDGLRGDEISLPARILALVDTFDAMTTDRPYQKGKDIEQAIKELSGLTHLYDRDVIEVFARLVKDGSVAEVQRLSREGKLNGHILTGERAEREQI